MSNDLLNCKFQHIDDRNHYDDKSCDISKPVSINVERSTPLKYQLPTIKSRLKSPLEIFDSGLTLGLNGLYLDLDCTIDEQWDSKNIETFMKNSKATIILRSSLSARCQILTIKLLSLTGKEVKKLLATTLKIFERENEFMEEFLSVEGIRCILSVGTTTDETIMTNLLKIIDYIILFVDGINVISNYQNFLQWLYSLLNNKSSGICKSALKILLVFIEYKRSHGRLLWAAINEYDRNRTMHPNDLIIKGLKGKSSLGDHGDYIYLFMLLINKILSSDIDADTFYDISDSLEIQGMEEIIQKNFKKHSSNKNMVKSMQDYEMYLKSMDSIEVNNSSMVDLKQEAHSKKYLTEVDNKTDSKSSSVKAPESALKSSESFECSSNDIYVEKSLPKNEAISDDKFDVKKSAGLGSKLKKAISLRVDKKQSTFTSVVQSLDKHGVNTSLVKKNKDPYGSTSILANKNSITEKIVSIKKNDKSAVEQYDNVSNKSESLINTSTGNISLADKPVEVSEETVDINEKIVVVLDKVDENITNNNVNCSNKDTVIDNKIEKKDEKSAAEMVLPISDSTSEKNETLGTESSSGEKLHSNEDGAKSGFSFLSPIVMVFKKLFPDEQIDDWNSYFKTLFSKRNMIIKGYDFKFLDDTFDTDELDVDKAPKKKLEQGNMSNIDFNIPPLLPSSNIPPPLPSANIPPPPEAPTFPPAFLGPPPPPVSSTGFFSFPSKPQNMKLYWNEIKKSNIDSHFQRTIWSSIEKVSIDEAEIRNIFAVKKNANINKDIEKEMKKTLSFLDTKRKQNIVIAITKLPPMNSLQLTINEMDWKTLTKDDIERIIPLLPTDEEKKSLETAQAASPELPLDTAEQVIATFASIPHIDKRMNLLFYMHEHAFIEKEVIESIYLLNMSIEELQTNKTLHQFLSVLISIGNILNNSKVVAFKLPYILKTCEVKDTTKQKNSLLHHICQFMIDKLNYNGDFYAEIPNVILCSKIDFDFTNNMVEKLLTINNQAQDNLRFLTKYLNNNVKNKFSNLTKEGYDNYILIRGAFNRTLNRFLRHMQYFGYTTAEAKLQKIQDFYKLVKDFSLEFKTFTSAIITKREKLQKQHEKKKNSWKKDNTKRISANGRRKEQ